MGIMAIDFEERKLLHQVNLANPYSPRHTTIDQLDKFIREETIRLTKVDKKRNLYIFYFNRGKIKIIKRKSGHIL